MMHYPPLTQFGQTNLANSIFVTSQPPLYCGAWFSFCLLQLFPVDRQMDYVI